MAILRSLQSTLGAVAVLIGDDVPQRNWNDWSTQAPQRPLAVVRPVDAQGVAETLKACRQGQLPVVPQGGLTGLCGGARPEAGWVALSLERMVGIEEVDPDACTMTVKAGTPLELVQRAAADAGLYFALDLGSRGSCAIGGNLSTNAGGNRVIRYGMARELVLGLEWVLPDGTVITSLNKMLKNNAGYDLKHLFIGSEGTLGVITRIVLRLHAQPGSTQSALCALEHYDGVKKLLGQARSGLGPTLSAFEVMWPDYWEVVTQRVGVRTPISSGHGYYVLVEAQGTDPATDGPRFERWLESQMESGILADAAVAQSVADTKAFWGVRDACAEFFPTLGPHISYDVGLAVRQMDDFAQQCKAALAQRIPGCESVYYGHIGDGNLHLVSWVAGLSVEDQPKDAMDEVIYGLVREFAGSISAEHGIGTVKKPYLNYARSDAEIALMRTLKQALDPLGLLNPGKVV
jgi:FAD/FMN-containing dehydrogenase